MFFNYKHTRIYYKRENKGGKTVLLMHGFGADSKAVDCLFYFLKNRGYDVISLDFAGFGQSDQPSGAWTIYDYADCVTTLISALCVNSVTAIGHSFGGRVGIILASKNIVDSLILIDSAGLKPKRNPLYYARIIIHKVRKKLKIPSSKAGSKDYRSLSVNMRSTFVNVVNSHLDGLLSKIKVPTLILWGNKDKETPLYMAKKLNANIANSSLYVLDGGHFSYIDSYIETCSHMENFLCSL